MHVMCNVDVFRLKFAYIERSSVKITVSKPELCMTAQSQILKCAYTKMMSLHLHH